LETPEKRSQSNNKLANFSEKRLNTDNDEVLSRITKKTLSRFNEAIENKP